MAKTTMPTADQMRRFSSKSFSKPMVSELRSSTVQYLVATEKVRKPNGSSIAPSISLSISSIRESEMLYPTSSAMLPKNESMVFRVRAEMLKIMAPENMRLGIVNTSTPLRCACQ